MNEDEVKVSEKIQGEVRISIQDYTKLISGHVKAAERKSLYEDAVQSVGEFMQFIRKEDPERFNKFVDKFNDSSELLKIYIDEYGRPRMGMRGVKQ